MALSSNDINDLNRKRIIESSDVPGQPGIVVLNPDGTAVGAPVGGATSANQTNGTQKTQIVDAGGDAVTVTGGKLDVNATASLAGTALPISGATEGVGVAILDGSGNQITSFGGGTQYTEDVAAAANPVGTALNLIRADSLTGLTTTDGDNLSARGTDKGELYVKHADKISIFSIDAGDNNIGNVDIASSALPTGASTLAEQQSQTTHLSTIAGDTTSIQTAVELLDDTVATDGSATPTKGILMAGQDGTNAQTIKTDTNGELQVDVLTMPTTTVQATDLDIRPLVNTDVVTAELSAVDNAVLDTIAAKDFATQTTLAAINTKLVSGTDIGDVTINNAAGASAVNIQDGGNTITVDYATTGSGTATGALRVELPTNGTGVIATVGAVTAITNALPAGTNAIGKLAANSGVDIGDVDVTSVVPGTGATNLGKAEDGAHTSGDVGVMDLSVRNDTMADFTGADNDYTPKAVTAKGQTLTTNAPRGRKLHQITTITSSTSETTVLTAAASTYHDVYGVIVTNTSSTATEVSFKDATAGTTRFTISAPANDTRGFMVPVDAAVVQSATNNNWTATCADSVASIIITVLAVKNI